MGRKFMLAKSNFRKNRGTSAGLFLLMTICSMLISLVLLMYFDAYGAIAKRAVDLNAGDGVFFVGGTEEDIEDYKNYLISGDASEAESHKYVQFNNFSIEFGNGKLSPSVIFTDTSRFDTVLNKVEVVVADDSVTSDYIYLPYQFLTGGGYALGDTITFEILGESYTWNIKGFIDTTYFGSSNGGAFEFILDDETYDDLYLTAGDANCCYIVCFKLENGIKASKFILNSSNNYMEDHPTVRMSCQSVDEAISSKSFMTLILVVAFLIVNLIIILVVALMLSNTISNYIKENMKSIGALKAIGYSGSDIRQSLMILFGGLALLGSVVGSGLAYCLMPFLKSIVVGQSGILYNPSFRAYSVIVSLALVTLFVILVTAFSSRKIGKIEPIVALRDDTPSHSFKRNHVRLDKTNLNLNLSFALKTLFTNTKQNLITFLVTGLLVFVCIIGLLLFENFYRNPNIGILSFETFGGIITVDPSTADETEEYLKTRTDITNLRYYNVLNLTYNNEDRLNCNVFDDFSLMNNQDVCYEGRLPEYDNEVAVSGKFAKDYGFEVGDEVLLTCGDKSYNYLITGFVQTCNNFGREAAMTTSAAEHIIALSENDTMLCFDCADKEVCQNVIDDCTELYGEHIMSTINFYETIDGNMTIFKSIAMTLLIMVCIISAVVIMLILFLYIKALLYNKRRDYGISKALGYTSRDLILQTALSFMPSIVLAVIVSSFLSYLYVNPFLSLALLSFGLMKSSFTVPLGGVVIVGAGMIVISFVFAILGAAKIKNIEAYKMLVAE